MNPITRVVTLFSKRAKQKRADFFFRYFNITPKTRIMDIGSSDGSRIAQLLEGTHALPQNIYIADIDKRMLENGRKRFGFIPVVIQESGKVPFPDNYFDIVFCNSVIEHVTIPKDEIWSLYSRNEFRRRSLLRQKEFADEIRRIGKGYFVQTPNKWFPIESHTWLPFVALLPRPVLMLMLKVSNRIWVKKLHLIGFSWAEKKCLFFFLMLLFGMKPLLDLQSLSFV